MTAFHASGQGIAFAARSRILIAAAAFGLSAGLAGSLQPAAALPEIRTNERNRVPACVTPERMMRFLAGGNAKLLPQFQGIAKLYQQHGEANKVRWDYAFYQMVIETNYLKFVNNAGQGDVKPRQNNFAGIGTTGGGVPGDTFPDVSTGVLGQMQHLMAYSGERMANPVGPRTREKQDEIIQKSKALGRPVTFKDLARRWAVDGRYGSSIEFVAARFRAAHCSGQEPDSQEIQTRETPVAAKPEPRGGKRVARGRDSRERARLAATRGDTGANLAPAQQPASLEQTEPKGKGRAAGRELANRAIEDGRTEDSDKRSGLGATGSLPAQPKSAERPAACKVFTASYGGQKNVLIAAVADSEMRYTALQVIDGQEQSLALSFIRAHAPGGEALGEFASREAALLKAFDLCPTASRIVE